MIGVGQIERIAEVAEAALQGEATKVHLTQAGLRALVDALPLFFLSVSVSSLGMNVLFQGTRCG